MLPATNRPNPTQGLSSEDAFARRAMIEALRRAIWLYGVEPDCILVAKLARVLGVAGEFKLAAAKAKLLRQFTCANCGVVVVTESYSQKFCFDCASRRNEPALERRLACEGCGAQVITTIPNQKFCSVECRKRTRHAGAGEAFRFRCIECGCEDYAWASGKLYCSAACRRRYKERI